MDRDLYMMAEILGEDDEQVRSLLWMANDAAMIATVKTLMQNLVRQKGWDPQNLPKFKLPRSMSKSDYIIGKAVSGNVTGDDVGPSHDELDSHIGIFGQTGYGKTTLVKLLLLAFVKGEKQMADQKRTFFVWDAGGEYGNLIFLFNPGEVVWLDPDLLGINPLQVPLNNEGRPVMSPAKWIVLLRMLLRLLWLNEPSVNLFCELLDQEYHKRGVHDDPVNAVYPCLSDMLCLMENMEIKRGSDRDKARGKLLDRIGFLVASLPGLDVQCSRNVCELFGDHSVILDVAEVHDVARPFLFSFLCMALRAVFYTDQPTIERLMVAEEAHQVMPEQLRKRTEDLMEPISCAILRDVRKAGFSAVVVSQLVGDVDKSVRGNLGSVISLRQRDKDCIREAAGALNLSPWQSPELGCLPKRQAIARFSRYGDPVHIAVKDTGPILDGIKRFTREEGRARSKPVLDTIPFVKRRPKTEEASAPAPVDSAGTPDATPSVQVASLDPNEYTTFASIVRFPELVGADRRAGTALSPDADSRTIKKLCNAGLVGLVGKVGAKCKIHAPTDKGLALAAKLGLPVARPHKGGAVHRVLVHYVRQSLALRWPELRFAESGAAVTVDGVHVQPDLVAVHPSGRRIAVQCCAQNQPAYEADRLLRLLSLVTLGPTEPAKLEVVAAVAGNRMHRRSIQKAVEKQAQGMPEGLVLLDFDELVAGYDWSVVVGF